MQQEQHSEEENLNQEIEIKIHSILEDFEVYWNQKLGCGISGPVRPCKNKVTGERFALKCLVDKPRSRREVALHKKCSSHPHVVSIYDVYANEVQFPGERKPRCRLLVVMELMDGGELFDRISKQKYFTERQAASYTTQIVSAIERCHTFNIAHRDIKPENLLLKDNTPGAVIKLSDFGFAKEDDGSLMTPHFTPYYVAPQILEAQKTQARQAYHIVPDSTPYTYDKSCDMWSLGVIVYIMLCGYPPFYSETPSKQITRHMKKKIMAGEYDFPREDWSHVSPQAKDLVTSLLRVDAALRLTVEQVLAHPWLHEAPPTQLNSPAVMLDQNGLFEVKHAHSEQLTSMRLPDKNVQLKNMAEANNPILRKRLHSRLSIEAEAPPMKTLAYNAPDGVEKLRDVIAHCIMPPKGMKEDAYKLKLNKLVSQACDCNMDSANLVQILTNYQWTGEKFLIDPDRQKFAITLSELVQQMVSSSSLSSHQEHTSLNNSSTNNSVIQQTETTEFIPSRHSPISGVVHDSSASASS